MRHNSYISNFSRIFKIIIFGLFISGVLYLAQNTVKAKFIGDSTTIVNGFYAEKRNSIDLLVIGSSNSFCTIDPITLYEEYGIKAYDFGSSSQPLNISLLYLKEALKTQKPKVVALETNMIIGDCIERGNEAAFRWGYTDIPISADKLISIYQSTGKVNKDYFTYIFPMFRYHDRWKELSKTDYTYLGQDKTNYSKGYLETMSVSEQPVLLEFYHDYEQASPEHCVSVEAMQYIDKIKRICDKNAINLVLFKSPKEGWYVADTLAIKQIADERNIEFIDYNELYDLGELELDVLNDFRDKDHLNDFGAKKISSDFGQRLINLNILNNNTNDLTNAEKIPNSWDKALAYRQRQGWQPYMEATTVKECLERLQQESEYVLVVTDTNYGPDKNYVHQWVYDDGKILIDHTWEETGIKHVKIGKSEFVLSKYGPLYQILIDGVENYEEGSRWHIIVYDKAANDVVKKLQFDE